MANSPKDETRETLAMRAMTPRIRALAPLIRTNEHVAAELRKVYAVSNEIANVKTRRDFKAMIRAMERHLAAAEALA